MDQVFLVTGGAGFIGSHLVDRLLAAFTDARVVVLDALTYAGSLDHLAGAMATGRCAFVRADVADPEAVASILAQHRPTTVFHLAAESHVDRSIDGGEAFVRTNVMGTFTLLEALRRSLAAWPAERRERFRFVHVSTDEVYGSTEGAPPPREGAAYAPSSPYAATKAAADHLVRAFHRTYGLPSIVALPCNTYGPRQYPEKLIPLLVRNVLEGQMLPLYGDGWQEREWLHVADHCEALLAIADRGAPGSTYHVGSGERRSNRSVALAICEVLDLLAPTDAGSHRSRIAAVPDRPGHDRRYALDASRIHSELGWLPRVPFDEGLHATVTWYLAERATGAASERAMAHRVRRGLPER